MSSAKRRAHASSSRSPVSSIATRTSSLARESGSQLWSAMRYSRDRAAARQSAATPLGPTSFSTNGISPFVKRQLISPATTGCPPVPVDRSGRLVHELGRDVHRIRERIAHGRLAVDVLLALADLVLRSRALDRDRVVDVRDAVAHRLVVPEHPAGVDV